MVNVVTSFGKSGLHDWLIQRVTAVILFIYCILIFCFFIFNKNISYDILNMFFDNVGVKIFTLISILSLSAHAWVGLWTVLTDYVKFFYLRLPIQILINLLLISYVFIGIEILWRT